jgi:hypothetical protein
MKWWNVLLIVCLMASCSPQKRLARLVEKHPELLTENLSAVPVTLKDTLYLKPDSGSVVFSMKEWREMAERFDGESLIAKADAERSTATLSLIDEDRELVRLQVKTLTDTIVFIHNDTVFVPEITYKTETEYVEKEQSWSDKLLHKSGKLFWLILLVLFFLFVFKRIVEL